MPGTETDTAPLQEQTLAQATMEGAADFILPLALKDGDTVRVCLGCTDRGLWLALDGLAADGMIARGGGAWRGDGCSAGVTFWHGIDGGKPFVLRTAGRLPDDDALDGPRSLVFGGRQEGGAS